MYREKDRKFVPWNGGQIQGPGSMFQEPGRPDFRKPDSMIKRPKNLETMQFQRPGGNIPGTRKRDQGSKRLQEPVISRERRFKGTKDSRQVAFFFQGPGGQVSGTRSREQKIPGTIQFQGTEVQIPGTRRHVQGNKRLPGTSISIRHN
jgi:hypothetical protein